MLGPASCMPAPGSIGAARCASCNTNRKTRDTPRSICSAMPGLVCMLEVGGAWRQGGHARADRWTEAVASRRIRTATAVYKHTRTSSLLSQLVVAASPMKDSVDVSLKSEYTKSEKQQARHAVTRVRSYAVHGSPCPGAQQGAQHTKGCRSACELAHACCCWPKLHLPAMAYCRASSHIVQASRVLRGRISMPSYAYSLSWAPTALGSAEVRLGHALAATGRHQAGQPEHQF